MNCPYYVFCKHFIPIFGNVLNKCDRYPLFVCSRSHVENIGSIT